MKILVIGSSGSGKTYTSKYLREKGINAPDLDLVKDLSGYFDFDGNRVECPVDADKEWMENHHFAWNRDVFKGLLSEQEDVFAFGMAGNAFDMLDLFDKVYFLKASPEVLAERLRHPSRENPMGSTDFQLQNAVQWGMKIQKRAEDLGIEMIDALQTPEQIFEQINKRS